MATSTYINDSIAVTNYIQNLEPTFGKVVEAIRQLILSADIVVGEHIKWNSPAFFFLGELEAFDAKEYKRDIVVLNVHKGYALLVFPTGAKLTDTHGLLEGEYTDGRRMAKFHDINEVENKGENLQKIIKDWLKLVEIPAQKNELLSLKLAKPAQRALENAGIFSLEQVAKLTADELSQLHGIGKNALEKLANALITKGLSFSEK